MPQDPKKKPGAAKKVAATVLRKTADGIGAATRAVDVHPIDATKAAFQKQLDKVRKRLADKMKGAI